MSTTITVTSAAELNQALSQATGGETILLAAGDYGKLVLRNTQFASNVTIKSADPNAMASFSEVYLNNASNVTFDEILFDYTFTSGEQNHVNKFQIYYSTNIVIDNSIFDGDFASGTGTSADGTGYGKGLVIRGSDNVDVINSEFHSWWKALGAGQSTNINFSGNNIHTIRSDGITLGEVQNVLIENNYIHDFGGAAGSNDHRDMIQVQRSTGTGSSDITIRNNVLDMGSGDYTQGIWFGGDKAVYGNAADWHHNVTIENNIIYNAHANGLAVHQTDGLTITNNTLIAVPRELTGGVTIPKIIVTGGSTNVTIAQNVTPAIVGDSATWTMWDNVFVQNTDPSSPGYYGTQFNYIATAAVDGYNQYGVIPGSLVDQLNAGSTLVDNYPFDYNSWVGASSTTVTNPGGSGSGTTTPGGGTTTPTPPDSGSSTPPDSGSSTPPDSGSSTPPDSGSSTPPDSGSSTPDAPDGDTSASDTSDGDTSDSDTSDGDTSDSDAPDGDTSDSDAPDGDTSDSDTSDSDTSDSDGPQSRMDLDDFMGRFARVWDGGEGGHKRPAQVESSDSTPSDFEFAEGETDGAPQRSYWDNGNVRLNKFSFAAARGETDSDFELFGGRTSDWGFGSRRNDRTDDDFRSVADDEDAQFADSLGGLLADFWN